MSFTDKQRDVLIAERGKPTTTIEFDVFEGNKVSMWTHFYHSADYNEVKKDLTAIRDHLNEFLRDEKMCPFHNNCPSNG